MFALFPFLIFLLLPFFLLSSISSSLSLILSPGSTSVYAVLPIYIDSKNSFDITISIFPKTFSSTPLIVVLRKEVSNIENFDNSLIIEQCRGVGIQICSINGTFNKNSNEIVNGTVNNGTVNNGTVLETDNGTVNGTLNETANGTVNETANGTVNRTTNEEEDQSIYVYFVCKSNCEFEYQVDFFEEKVLEEGKNFIVKFNERTDQILKLYIPEQNGENLNETRLQINFR